MPRILGKHAIIDIRKSISNCKFGQLIPQEIQRLADYYGVKPRYIYKLTQDIRPQRNRRSDHGNRKLKFGKDTNLDLAAGLVLQYNLNPSDAMLQMAAEGYALNIRLQTFQKYLREHKLNKKHRQKSHRAYRRFEAKEPAEAYQFDISGYKMRWLDLTTRKIIKLSPLEVSKNHPQSNKNLVDIWRFAITDDYSRYTYWQYYACNKPNGTHVTDFLLRAYSELGVPKLLYTDNDSIIKFGRTKRANLILSKALEKLGGYQIKHHMPGNAAATGKIESRHQVIEGFERVTGIFLDKGGLLTIDALNNRFAVNAAQLYNRRVHRDTGETPESRWFGKISSIRKIDYKLLKSALMSDEFSVVVRGDLSLSIKGNQYQLPTSDKYQFARLIGERVTLIFPDELDFYTLIDRHGDAFYIDKTEQRADIAGEYRQTAESADIKLRRYLKTKAKQHCKKQKKIIAPSPTIFMDVPVIDKTAGNVARFPKPKQDVSREILASAPGAPNLGLKIDYWKAVELFKEKFDNIGECKKFMDDLFVDRSNSELFEADIEKHLENKSKNTQLKAI